MPFWSREGCLKLSPREYWSALWDAVSPAQASFASGGEFSLAWSKEFPSAVTHFGDMS